MTYNDLLKKDYSEYLFRAEYITERDFEEQKNRYISASFTAWQIGCQNGLTLSWKKYLQELGLSEKPKLTKRQSDKLSETSKRILKRLGKI